MDDGRWMIDAMIFSSLVLRLSSFGYFFADRLKCETFIEKRFDLLQNMEILVCITAEAARAEGFVVRPEDADEFPIIELPRADAAFFGDGVGAVE